MGLHTGAVQLDGNQKYLGYATLALTQRIMSAGHGGQILLSGATRELVRDCLPADSILLDLGEKQLKDLLRPEHLYHLNAAGLPSKFPPLMTLDVFPNNLPMQLTTFIGREREIAEVKQDLEAHRLVTLTGSGGTGKTRLSLQVAADLLERFDHGVWFVELASLTDPELIPQMIISAIGISEQAGKQPLEYLKEYLRAKQMLIVLDNCEHLIEASARIVNSLLDTAPRLKVLASSREALGVRGELSYPVPSLSLPDVKHLPAIEILSQYEAVRLFIERAELVSPHFVVNKENAPAIAQICYRLDGIPLAIELAAARVKMMPVEQISMRLDDRFRLLTGGARTALPRQQTLRALIDWSYDILSENERLLLRRLSVFADGWTLEAAEEVCAGQNDILPYDVLDLLTQLINKSLVVVIEQAQGREGRYRMLETIRQYAREKLMEAGGSELIWDRHLAYFVELVERAEPELYQSDQVRWSNRLEDELDNLRMALEWAYATDVEAGLQIAALPWRFWDARGYLQEMGEWLAKLLTDYNAIDSLRVRALTVYSFCLFRKGEFPETIRTAEQSLQMARLLSDKQNEAFSLSLLGLFTLLQGNAVEAIPLLEQSLALYRALGDKIGQATTMQWLSVHHQDLSRVPAYAWESLKLYRELGDSSDVVSSLNTLARLTIWSGDFSSAVPLLEEALSTSHQLSNQTLEEEALILHGVLAYWQNNYEQAIEYYQAAILMSEKYGDHFQYNWARVFLAYVVLRQGKLQQAREMFADNIRSFQKAGFMIALIFAVEGLASLNVDQGLCERALRLYVWADTMRDQIGDHRPPVEKASVERDLDIIHTQLDDSAVEIAYKTGRSMTLEQAIELALS
jgi:predicted ATPase